MSAPLDFPFCRENEFQWRNLYLVKYKACTYKAESWRETYELRRRCPWYPVLLWVNDTLYRHAHLFVLVRLARGDDRECLVKSLVKLVATADGELVNFVAVAVARDLGDRVTTLHPRFDFAPGQTTPALLRHLTSVFGAPFLRRVLSPLLRRRVLRQEQEEVKGFTRAEKGARLASNTALGLAGALLERIAVLKESIPLEIWTCMTQAQRLHNRRVLAYLEVPGFDTRLITVEGTKESRNPRAREITQNCLLCSLFLGGWLAPALRTFDTWGVVDHNLPQGFSALLDGVAAVLRYFAEGRAGDAAAAAAAAAQQPVGADGAAAATSATSATSLPLPRPVLVLRAPKGLEEGGVLHKAVLDTLDAVMRSNPENMRPIYPNTTDDDVDESASVVTAAAAAGQKAMAGMLAAEAASDHKIAEEDVATMQERLRSLMTEMLPPKGGGTQGARSTRSSK